MMTNNMPETMKKHQKNWGKNWEKVRKRSKQYYEDKKKGYVKGIYLKKNKQKLKEYWNLYRKNISELGKQKNRDYMKECKTNSSNNVFKKKRKQWVEKYFLLKWVRWKN